MDRSISISETALPYISLSTLAILWISRSRIIRDLHWPTHCNLAIAAANRISSEATMDIGMSLFLANTLMAALVYIVIEIIWQE